MGSFPIRRRTLLAGTAGLALLLGGGLASYLWVGSGATGFRAKRPRSVTKLGETLQFDFGAVWFGNVSILGAANAGRTVRVRLGEKLGEDGRIDRKPPGTVRYHEADITLASGDNVPALTEADSRGIEDPGRPVMPFRYLEIDGLVDGPAADSIELHALVARAYDPAGSMAFAGSPLADPLNKLVRLGAHTMEATSFMGYFVDGDRERLAYEADGYINQLGWHATAGEPSVPRRTIAELLKKPTWPSEWMVHLIFMVWADYEFTGDTDYLASVIDRLPIFSLSDFIDDTGLVTTTNKPLAEKFVAATGADYLEDIVDWPQGERDGYEMVAYNTVVNAFVYEGQRLLSLMYAALGRDAESAERGAIADALLQAIQAKLIDRRTGLFVDGVGSLHSSAHASFVPLAFGLVPPENVDATVAHLASRIAANDGGFPCSVYAAQYLLEGLYRAERPNMAMQLLLNGSVRGWRNMLERYDATITHEAWDPRFKENIDWTHAWGAAFLNIIQRFVIGARAIGPGWSKWTLEPALAIGLTVEATVPTPAGAIDVKVDPDAKRVEIRAPSQTVFVAPTRLAADGWAFRVEPASES